MRKWSCVRWFFPVGMLAAFTMGGCTMAVQQTIQGSGTLKTEVRPVRGIAAVTLAGIGNLIIEKTGTESLTVSAEDNLLPLIQTEMQGATLVISVKSDHNIHPTKPITYVLTVNDLARITLSGAGSISSAGFHTAALALTLSGAGSANFTDLEVADLNTTLSGTGSISITGTTQTMEMSCSGVGQFSGKDFASQVATVSLSGVGSAAVRVSGALTATVSGVGSLTYYGHPASVKQRVTGIGSVKNGGA